MPWRLQAAHAAGLELLLQAARPRPGRQAELLATRTRGRTFAQQLRARRPSGRPARTFEPARQPGSGCLPGRLEATSPVTSGPAGSPPRRRCQAARDAAQLAAPGTGQRPHRAAGSSTSSQQALHQAGGTRSAAGAQPGPHRAGAPAEGSSQTAAAARPMRHSAGRSCAATSVASNAPLAALRRRGHGMAGTARHRGRPLQVPAMTCRSRLRASGGRRCSGRRRGACIGLDGLARLVQPGAAQVRPSRRASRHGRQPGWPAPRSACSSTVSA
jgi:hypothetical protein